VPFLGAILDLEFLDQKPPTGEILMQITRNCHPGCVKVVQ